VAALDALFAEYRKQGAGRFDYHVIEVKDEATRAHAKELGLVEQPFAEAGDGGVSLVQGFMGLAFSYGAEKDSIKFLPPPNTGGLEFWIDNKVRELRAKAEGRSYRLGVLTGHGAIAPTEPNLVSRYTGTISIQGIITQNFPFYAFHDVDLSGGSDPIDPGLDGLLVTQPPSDLTDAELARIDEFVLRGKSVAFFVGAANVRRGDASMHAALSTHGLERLLAGYGIELGRDLVVDLDPKASVSIVVSTTTGVSHMALAFVPVVSGDDRRLDTSFPVFFRLEEVAFPLASSVVLHPERQPEARLRSLAHTSPRAVRVTGDDVDLHPLHPWRPTGAEGPVVPAAAEDGTLHGAFDPSRKATGHARVLVVASSQFLANPLARAGNAVASDPNVPPVGGDDTLLQLAGPYAQQEVTSTILVFKNTLDWLSFEDDFVDCSLMADAGR
jgi:ABC-type uncharacterized transport system